MESNGKMKLNNLIGLISHFEGDIRSTLLIDGYYETTKLI